MKTSTLRKWAFVHRWTSIASTAFLLMLCLTGLPLIFHEEIEHWSEPQPQAGAGPSPSSTPSPNALLTQAHAVAGPGMRPQFIICDQEKPLVTVGLSAPPGQAQESVRTYLFDRSGQPAPEAGPSGTGFMDILLQLHTDMFLGDAGLYFLGVVGLLMAAAIVSGIVLYAPFMRKLPFATVRADRGRRLRWLDIHNLLGIVTMAWLLTVGLTGTINTLEKPIGAFWRHAELDSLLALHRAAPYPARLASADAVLAEALRANPGAEPVSIIFPGHAASGPGHFLVVLVGTGPLTKRMFSTTLVDGSTGLLTQNLRMPWYVKALYVSQPLHFGDYGGLPLKIIWAVLDLAAIVVLATGLYLWLRKSNRPRKEEGGTKQPSRRARLQRSANCGPAEKGRSLWGVFQVPAMLAVVSMFGLVSALIGDGGWDAMSWAALGIPASIAVYAFWIRQ